MVDKQNLSFKTIHEIKIILLWQKKTKKEA